MRISDWSSDVCSSDLDDDRARVALAVNDLDVVAEAAAQLVEQGRRVVVVDEAHRLARLERAQRAEDRRVAEASRDAAGVERVRGVGGGCGLDGGGAEAWRGGEGGVS